MSTETLTGHLRDIFGDRLRMVAQFGGDTHTCAVVATLTLDDLERCAAHERNWRKLGLDTPLLIVETELSRAMDAFPLELSEIIATRRVIAGHDVFADIVVGKPDLRRACEVQARGHVLHLREGFIEAAGDTAAVSRLVSAAVVPFRALVTNVGRLEGISPKALVTQLGLDNFENGFPEALRAAERIVDYVDQWSH